MQCKMDHIVLNVEDDEKMIAFYRDVLRLATDRLADYQAGKAPFPSVRLNPYTIIDLFPKRLWQADAAMGPGRSNLNHLCLAMDNISWDGLVARLEANHVTIEAGLVD